MSGTFCDGFPDDFGGQDARFRNRASHSLSNYHDPGGNTAQPGHGPGTRFFSIQRGSRLGRGNPRDVMHTGGILSMPDIRSIIREMPASRSNLGNNDFEHVPYNQSRQTGDRAAQFMEQHTDFLNHEDSTDPPNTDCPICLESIEEQVCVQIKQINGCSHVIGLSCLQEFLECDPDRKKECPLCRTEWIPEEGMWQTDEAWFRLGQTGGRGGGLVPRSGRNGYTPPVLVPTFYAHSMRGMQASGLGRNGGGRGIGNSYNSFRPPIFSSRSDTDVPRDHMMHETRILRYPTHVEREPTWGQSTLHVYPHTHRDGLSALHHTPNAYMEAYLPFLTSRGGGHLHERGHWSDFDEGYDDQFGDFGHF